MTANRTKINAEAVNRMQIIGLDPGVRAYFKEGGLLCSDRGEGLRRLSGKEKKMVSDFEEKYPGFTSYHVVRSVMEDPDRKPHEMYAVLFVVGNTDEWEADRKNLVEGYPICYAKNIADPEHSELGPIRVSCENGIISRRE